MGFFDLNIPHHESDRHVTDKPSLRGRRLKLALKAMELGYSGVAYNRTLKGVMSESDRCSTGLFPISKLTPISSSFFASVKFHRELLNVAVSAPFRQYTRLTVIVDSQSQASTLNAGNPILRSYDIVAVRPSNQKTFDQACQTLEVDMIAIDFSEKLRLPFMLKKSMVTAAIKRGVYFEITYSGLIADAQSRQQMINNCKLLVDWTRGKNLILCSAAPSATELRGPQDVANLLFLLGLPRERAKAAISSNCRCLLANALRKKHFYKEAVKVEEIPSGVHVNPAKSMFDDWLKWDPISSGEGDLLLDDMEKFSAISKTIKENKKTIDFTSNLNGLPAHGFQIKDLIYAKKAAVEPPGADKLALQVMETEGDASDEKLEEQGGFNTLHKEQCTLLKNSVSNLSKDHGGVGELPEGQISSSGATNIYLTSGCQESEFPSGYVPEEAKNALLPLQVHVGVSNDVAKIGYQMSDLEDSMLLSLLTSNVKPADSEKIIPTSNEKLKYSIDLEVNCSDDLEQNLVTSKIRLQDTPSPVDEGIRLHDGGQVHITKINTLTADNRVSLELSNPLSISSSSAFPLDSAVENRDMGVCAHEGTTMNKLFMRNGIENMQVQPLASSHTSYEDGYVENREYSKMTDSSGKLGDGLPLEGSSNVTTNFDSPIIDDVMGELKQIDSVPDYQGLAKSHAGMSRRKGKSPHQPFLFPFKRFLKPRHFKRKPRKLGIVKPSIPPPSPFLVTGVGKDSLFRTSKGALTTCYASSGLPNLQPWFSVEVVSSILEFSSTS
ncbi:polymerase/histidinol phosphatase-like protein [Perilla frutescens var. hirtella]|uniref:Polymerase/histidinol phosphatase-like protein n=1 Tax=Perilla frutescens var. hirtella TaxID=608512 RepID=A0AAD4IV21_PERFH|nr:polymerase/histidinol phosphatase-like protein [Perilla frutescens var. hirtella]